MAGPSHTHTYIAHTHLASTHADTHSPTHPHAHVEHIRREKRLAGGADVDNALPHVVQLQRVSPRPASEGVRHTCHTHDVTHAVPGLTKVPLLAESSAAGAAQRAADGTGDQDWPTYADNDTETYGRAGSLYETGMLATQPITHLPCADAGRWYDVT